MDDIVNFFSYAPNTLYLVILQIIFYAGYLGCYRQHVTALDLKVLAAGTLLSYFSASWKISVTAGNELHSLYILPIALFMYLPFMHKVHEGVGAAVVFFSILIVDVLSAIEHFKHDSIYVQLYGIGGAGLLDGLVVLPLMFIVLSLVHRRKYSALYISYASHY